MTETSTKPRKRITLKNELPELIEAVCNHEHCPKWLYDGIWDLFNEQNQCVNYSATYWRAAFEAIRESAAYDEARHVKQEEEDRYGLLATEVIDGGVQ